VSLIEKIAARQAEIGVIDLGYVGLPLVFAFCRAGFDVDPEKVDMLKLGRSYIRHIDLQSIEKGVLACFTPTADFARLSKMDCIVVWVPTPLNKNREPDMSYVLNTSWAIARQLREDQLVVLDSTTHPGTTDGKMRGVLEKSGLKAGADFYIAISPEREDPNNKEFPLSSVPKLVGGFSQACLQ
jgi:UDP-N-acetyl-D-glucosamine dehydrogenase